jgi:NADH-quinone oxidoreductase subunit J
MPMTGDLALFLVVALLAAMTALAVITSLDAVYSVIFLVLHLGTISVLYLLLHAPFIAMVQVTVYAGAIVVLFLFVIMLLGPEREKTSAALPWQRPVAIVMGSVMVILLVYALMTQISPALSAAPAADFGSPQSVGRLLFQEYLIPFEATSILLLAAMVGAIVLTRDERRARP